MEDVSLKDYLIGLIDERDKRYDQRFGAQEKAVNAALAAAQAAVDKAEKAVDRRLDNTNEWRQALNDLVRGQRSEGIGLKSGWGWAIALISTTIAIFSFLK